MTIVSSSRGESHRIVRKMMNQIDPYSNYSSETIMDGNTTSDSGSRMRFLGIENNKIRLFDFNSSQIFEINAVREFDFSIFGFVYKGVIGHNNEVDKHLIVTNPLFARKKLHILSKIRENNPNGNQSLLVRPSDRLIYPPVEVLPRGYSPPTHYEPPQISISFDSSAFQRIQDATLKNFVPATSKPTFALPERKIQIPNFDFPNSSSAAFAVSESLLNSMEIGATDLTYLALDSVNATKIRIDSHDYVWQPENFGVRLSIKNTSSGYSPTDSSFGKNEFRDKPAIQLNGGYLKIATRAYDLGYANVANFYDSDHALRYTVAFFSKTDYSTKWRSYEFAEPPKVQSKTSAQKTVTALDIANSKMTSIHNTTEFMIESLGTTLFRTDGLSLNLEKTGERYKVTSKRQGQIVNTIYFATTEFNYDSNSNVQFASKSFNYEGKLYFPTVILVTLNGIQSCYFGLPNKAMSRP